MTLPFHRPGAVMGLCTSKKRKTREKARALRHVPRENRAKNARAGEATTLANTDGNASSLTLVGRVKKGRRPEKDGIIASAKNKMALFQN